jgi:dienelactone hydrolase
MAEIVLFHHAGGLTPGVAAYAGRLRAAGHRVHTPDLFDGRTFADVADGVAYAQETGEEVFAARADRAVADLPAEVVYLGMSMGCARAAEQVLRRPGAVAALFLYGAVDPGWWGATWPAGVPSQAHLTEGDPWREIDAEEAYLSAVPGGELFVYEGAGHLFAEEGHRDYDEQTAGLATERLLAFLGERRVTAP